MRKRLDGSLQSWSDLKNEAPWNGLLLGNGASRAVWSGFEYRSLLTVSQLDDLVHPLGGAELTMFEALQTKNFEAVLGALRTAATVNRALGMNDTALVRAYQSIRLALIEAVHWVHPPRIPDSTRLAIRNALREYEWIFTTNYDLIIYWSVMLAPFGEGFVDFFWNKRLVFDPADVEPFEDQVTRVLYIHGALHLARDAFGSARKHRWEPGTSLLGSFQAQSGDVDDWIPLFVSEGDSRDKMRAISGSDYLSFAYQSLVDHKGPLVVFGHSLSDEDSHLVRAVKVSHKDRRLAFGIVPQSESHVISEKGRLVSLFPNHSHYYFDAETHPLGAETLRVSE